MFAGTPPALDLRADGCQFQQLADFRRLSMNRFSLTRQLAFTVAALTFLGLGLTATAAHPVPFKGRADVTVTNAVPVPAGLQLTGSATGQATHLGQFTRTETIVLGPTGAFTGTLVFTAANGDELTADVAGQFTSATSAVGAYEFSGGTGRFQNASGGADFEATTADGVNFDVTFAGSIHY
jgi:hypothetical protein